MALVLIASLVATVSAKSFLETKVDTSSIERALLSELSGKADAVQLLRIEEQLHPMFAALPKNKHGRLDSASVRYALHRYFMHKHGWYVNGLGAANSTDDTSSASSIMKARAPSFIQHVFEQRLHGQGLDHHELAVFAATLTDLIHNEVSGNLQEVYANLELPTAGPVTEEEFDIATKAYLLGYLSGGREEVTTLDELPAVELSWDGDYPAWKDTLMWASDLKVAIDTADKDRRNPFTQRRWRSFEQQMSFLQECGHLLGPYQNLECHTLKDLLSEMEDDGTGRVPLSRFYRGGVEGDWTFSESVEYLRHIGALDDTNPKRMSVIIPNYIQSQSNCLAGSSFYSVCCSDECEGLMQHLERDIATPSAAPGRIAEVVSGLHSDTVDAPRNLSAALLDRLQGIGRLHGGYVPLHGRLFAQWMHHAYPRECPFPHVSGTTTPMSPADWMDHHDIDNAEATMEEMQLHHSRLEHEASVEEDVTLPWIHVEELLLPEESGGSWLSAKLRWAMAVAVLASFAVPLLHSQVAASSSNAGKLERFLV